MYFLGASFDLPIGIYTFYQDGIVKPIIMWLGANLITTLPFFLFFNKKNKILGLILSILITIVPPFGLFAWNHFITTSGYIFPGLGYIGIVLFFLLIISFKYIKFTILLVFISILANIFYQNQTSTILLTINTYFEESASKLIFQEKFERLKIITQIIKKNKGENILVLPENVLGRIDNTQKKYWMRNRINQTVWIGAEIPHNTQYYNVILSLDKGELETIYTQRVPVPMGMWNPFSQHGAIKNWVHVQKPYDLNGHKVNFYICYEAFTPWLFISDFLYEPTNIVLSSNLWWAKHTKIKTKLKNNFIGWAKLFNTPYHFSVNGG